MSNGSNSPPPSAEDAEVARAMNGNGVNNGSGDVNGDEIRGSNRSKNAETDEDDEDEDKLNKNNQRKMIRANSSASSVISGRQSWIFVCLNSPFFFQFGLIQSCVRVRAFFPRLMFSLLLFFDPSLPPGFSPHFISLSTVHVSISESYLVAFFCSSHFLFLFFLSLLTQLRVR